VVSFTPRPLYTQGKSPCYPLDTRLGGVQSRSRHGGDEKNSQPLSGFEPLMIQPIVQRYTSELSRLIYFTRVQLNVILLSPSLSTKWLLFKKFPTKILYTFLVSFLPTYPSHRHHPASPPQHSCVTSCRTNIVKWILNILHFRSKNFVRSLFSYT
jgi:hypothetical protein